MGANALNASVVAGAMTSPPLVESSTETEMSVSGFAYPSCPAAILGPALPAGSLPSSSPA
eukprot:CAMPEP_0178602168 /NCGR_PEP_ID=MMETSP0697-20121206/34817_1 /TAXON_ID=265572 /ORGANISM="Extubocellulus spinifer, Strain CCMP396" /LENGTH=59 /DNA_ID=CAMNT_0020240355 /DNA_START=22 /DNA_END=201 /DNA_ORIENTATION=-